MMNFLLGTLFYAILTMFCGACLRRFARETDRVLLVLGSLCASVVLLILGGALLLPWFSPVRALIVLSVLCTAGLIAIGPRTRSLPMTPRKDALWLTVAALPGGVLVAYFALFIMSWSFGVDDGFFLHSSNIGMILAGKYPPTSFLGEPLQGHYGKDILTALLSQIFGINFLQIEWLSTVTLQVLHFFFLVHWFRVETGKAGHALLGAHFAFFASAFSEHEGLVDTIANNNAVAYITVSVCSYLAIRWYRNGANGAAVVAGVLTGADALIYEIHFGLIVLALFTLSLPRRDRFRGFLLFMVVAGLLATVEGGVITHLAQKKLFGKAQYQQNSKKAWQSQNVEIKFPKAQPFYLRRDNLRPSRFFETKLRPDSVDFSPSRETAPLWSAPILSVFWYPVWLSPLVLAILVWQRNLLAGWFFAFGTYSLLTPCLVSFGYFEGETTRWLFGTAVGLSTAYGLTLAEALYAPNKKLRYLAYIVCVWSIWFNTPAMLLELKDISYAFHHIGEPQLGGSPGIVSGGGLIPRPRLNLAHHHRFGPDEFKITEALRLRGKEERDFLAKRYLVNYRDERVAQGFEIASGGIVNKIGLQTGLCGRLPAGLAGAPDNKWSTPSLGQTLEARLFWYHPELWRLQELKAKWLVVDKANLDQATLDKIADLKGVRTIAESGNMVLFESPDAPAEAPRCDSIESLQAFTLDEALPSRNGFVLPALLRAKHSGSTQFEFRYQEIQSGLIANPDDLLHVRVGFGAGENHLAMSLMGPYFPGEYQLQYRVTGTEEWQNLAQLTFTGM